MKAEKVERIRSSFGMMITIKGSKRMELYLEKNMRSREDIFKDKR